jgi:hypothetical protein
MLKNHTVIKKLTDQISFNFQLFSSKTNTERLKMENLFNLKYMHNIS